MPKQTRVTKSGERDRKGSKGVENKKHLQQSECIDKGKTAEKEREKKIASEGNQRGNGKKEAEKERQEGKRSKKEAQKSNKKW